MKKILLNGLALMTAMFAINATAQTRYVDPVFPAVTKTSNIMYDSNSSVNILYGQYPGIQPLFSHKLNCDIYQPTGDASLKRPLVILIPTGSFLPAIVNKQVTGNKNDSTIVELANQFAMRGYVVAAIDYRGGWNPLASQAQATEMLIQATFRAMQDARNCVRFFRNNASTYRIDTSMIIVGGQGTGGYVALGMANVSTRADIESNIKFKRGDGSPMVSMDTLGDWTGVGGWAPMNYGPMYNQSSKIHMVFNYGGALGDSLWIKSTSTPMVGIQSTNDFFAPYNSGNVIVPATGFTVIPNAKGIANFIPAANMRGVNNKLNSIGYTDPISMRALKVSGGVNNMYGLEGIGMLDNAPWEWWMRPLVQTITVVPYAGAPLTPPFGGYILANGREADSLGNLTNPTMGPQKARAYCDTIAKFVAPRIAVQFDITGNLALNAFNLVSPANNTAIDIYDSSTKFMMSSWTKASVTGAMPGTTVYMFQIDTSMTFMNPIMQYPVVDSLFTAAPQSAVFGLLTQCGVGANQTKTLYWRIMASNPHYGKLSTNTNALILTKKVVTGLNEANLNAFVNLYPNPAKDQVNVSMDNSKSAINTMMIVDIMGREVMTQTGINSHSHSINTSGFAPGIYIMNLKTTNGSIATKRFTIQ